MSPRLGSGPSLRAGAPTLLGVLALLAVAAPFLAQLPRTVGARSHPVLYGDQALIALGARRAADLDQLLGPYSRDGFHHLGPILFYLLAPLVLMVHPAGTALYTGALLLNGAALVAAVAVLWHRAGATAALGAAVAIDLWCWSVGFGTLREPWNPYLVVAPTVLFAILWAAGLTGSGPSVVWSLVVASYLAQTEIETAPFAIGMSAILLAVVLARRGLGRPSGRPLGPPRSFATWSGLVALVGMWVAPVAELWSDHPNNATLLWRYFSSAHPTAPLHSAVSASVGGLTILPLGNHDYVQSLDRGGWGMVGGVVILLSALGVASAVNWRRRDPLATGLLASGVIGGAIGVVSMSFADAPVSAYFATWLAFVPLLFVLSCAVALLDDRQALAGIGTRQRAGAWHSAISPRVVAVFAIVALVGASAYTSDLPQAAATTGSGPWPAKLAGTHAGRALTVRDTAQLTKAIEGKLRPADRAIELRIDDPSLWPLAAGAVLALEERGVGTRVDPSSWDSYFGSEPVVSDPMALRITISSPGKQAAPPTGGQARVLVENGVLVATYSRGAG